MNNMSNESYKDTILFTNIITQNPILTRRAWCLHVASHIQVILQLICNLFRIRSKFRSGPLKISVLPDYITFITSNCIEFVFFSKILKLFHSDFQADNFAFGTNGKKHKWITSIVQRRILYMHFVKCQIHLDIDRYSFILFYIFSRIHVSPLIHH